MKVEYTTPIYIAPPISVVEVLDKLAEKKKCHRSDLIRMAVENFVSEHEATAT
jgi:metal-responsive CopG/Arc/MetJ family transcriptional regulator